MIQRKSFTKGDVIIQENDFGEKIYILDQGKVEVSATTNGKKNILGVLYKGEIFGEMAVIDEKPRSATVTALEDCQVKVLHRDIFLDVIQMDKDISVKILRSLFSRLRRANLQNMKNNSNESQVSNQSQLNESYVKPKLTTQNPQSMRLEGLTHQAKTSLPQNPYRVDHFPCVIGRVTTDPFAKQDIALNDYKPFQVSRHHLLFERIGDRFVVTDMGSRLGFQVGEQRYGGREGKTSTELSNGDILVIGSGRSEFQFRVHL
jgi:CRP-like cAMP-binding protein